MIDPSEKIKVVELSPPDPEWAKSYIEESSKIKEILQDNLIDIHHIGSTAIPNIYAKPIIDILPVVKNLGVVDSLNSQFETLGYTCMGEYGIPGRRYYWKSKEKRSHHIHLFQEDSSEIFRHLAFRDFMRQNPEYAKAYSLIKKNLAEVFTYDIENYVNGKSSFVQLIDYKTGSARNIQLTAHDNIVIEPYNPAWPKLAEAEIKTIKTLIQLPFVQIEHIGSTAVPDLSSKSIIDIFIVVQTVEEAEKWIKPLEFLGYIFWDENPDKVHLRFFKGMPPFGTKRTHHIHIVDKNNPTFEQRILFRDILRHECETKNAYEKLKFTLSQSHKTDRESYTDAKGIFIETVLQENGYLKEIYH